MASPAGAALSGRADRAVGTKKDSSKKDGLLNYYWMVYGALSKTKGFQMAKKISKSAGKAPRQAHSKEFRESSVKMVLVEGVDVNEAAKRLGIETATLKRWVKKEQMIGNVRDREAMTNLLATNKKQKEEIRRLRMEREILKKAMAYFVPAQN